MKGDVKSLVDAYATSIIKTVMAECRVGKVDFATSMLPHHVKARATAIQRLSAAGVSELNISRIMGVHPTTVAYWKRPNCRAHRLDYAKNREARA
jgi:hypothetical protein